MEGEIAQQAIEAIQRDPQLLYSRVIVVAGKGWHQMCIRDRYGRILQTPWARDFCAQCGSWEEYAAHGAGYVALYGEELAAGASSYSWYQEMCIRDRPSAG